MVERRVVNLKALYGEQAKLPELSDYLEQAKMPAGEGNEVVLTGQAPVWLYLKVAHALHGRARRLIYASPLTGEIVIFDHDPFGGVVSERNGTSSCVSSPEDTKELTRGYDSDFLVAFEIGKVRVTADDEIGLCFEGGS